VQLNTKKNFLETIQNKLLFLQQCCHHSIQSLYWYHSVQLLYCYHSVQLLYCYHSVQLLYQSCLHSKITQCNGVIVDTKQFPTIFAGTFLEFNMNLGSSNPNVCLGSMSQLHNQGTKINIKWRIGNRCQEISVVLGNCKLSNHLCRNFSNSISLHYTKGIDRPCFTLCTI